MEVNVLLRPKSETDDQVLRYVRVQPPSHMVFKIQSFSMLKDALASTGKTCIESTEFIAGNCTWTLSIYPKGNAKHNGKEHISAYLKLKGGHTISATIRFFILNQCEDNFLTVEDLRVRCFDPVRTEWGISKLIPLSTFNDPSNGFLYDDCCIFGVEVFVLNTYAPTSASFLKLKGFENCSHSWKTELPEKFTSEIYSPIFDFEGYSWFLVVFQKEHDCEERVFLALVYGDSNDCKEKALYLDFDLSLRDNFNGDKEWKENAKIWCSTSSPRWSMSLPAESLIYKPNATNSNMVKYMVTLQVNFKHAFKLSSNAET